MNPRETEEFSTAINREVEEAIKFAQASPLPGGDEVVVYVYQ